MQHATIWVGQGLPRSSSSKSQRNDLNRLGSYLDAAALSNLDEGPDLAPPRGDLDTAHCYGRRIAEITLRLRGACSPNLVANGNEISPVREIPSSAERASA